MSAPFEQALAAMDAAIGHSMSQACPVCRGGWWHEDGEITGGVHASECPYADADPPPLAAPSQLFPTELALSRESGGGGNRTRVGSQPETPPEQGEPPRPLGDAA